MNYSLNTVKLESSESWECTSGPAIQGAYRIKALSEFVVNNKSKEFQLKKLKPGPIKAQY